MQSIPYGKQHITDEDIKAVIDALKSDSLTQGPRIAEFEDAFAKYIGVKYGVAVSNGTAALHLAAMALNVGEGTKVIATPITFAASTNAILYCGGTVDFADIDPQTYLLDIESVEKKLEQAAPGEYSGIVVVDLAGYPVNLEAFRKLADKYNLWLIEDACHAPGGYFIDTEGNKQYCGNGNYADLSVFSFHPVKHIACGEGGMITTNNETLYRRMLKLRTHGITKNANDFLNKEAGNSSYPGWYMEMQELGYNYRLTDIQAALGISQLRKADVGLERRRNIAARYNDAFSGKPWLKGQSGMVEGHAYHLYIIEVDDRLGLYNYLRSKNIFAQVHYIPVHLMPYYKNLGYRENDYPKAEQYYSRCLSLPMYPTLTDAEQEYVIKQVYEFFDR